MKKKNEKGKKKEKKARRGSSNKIKEENVEGIR